MSCAQARRRAIQPSLDCTNANSFQVMEEVTDGNEVMPSTMDSAKVSTPVEIKLLVTSSPKSKNAFYKEYFFSHS